MSTSTDILLPYSSNDFFYTRATDLKVNIDQDSCDAVTVTDSDCTTINSDNYTDCLQKSLCDNQARADTLYNFQNNNGGSYQRFIDVEKKYNDQVTNFYNLGIGISFLLGFICFKYI